MPGKVKCGGPTLVEQYSKYLWQHCQSCCSPVTSIINLEQCSMYVVTHLLIPFKLTFALLHLKAFHTFHSVGACLCKSELLILHAHPEIYTALHRHCHTLEV